MTSIKPIFLLLICLFIAATTLFAETTATDINLDSFLSSIPEPKSEKGFCSDKRVTSEEYLECLEQETTKNPTVENINFLAGVYALRKDLQKAIKTYEINVAKGDEKATYYMAGIINEGLKEHQRALPYFKRIKNYKDSTCQIGGILSVVEDEKSWNAFYYKFMAKRRTLNFYDEEIEKGNLKAYECKGLYYISLDEYDKAEPVYQSAIDKGDKEALFLMGQLFSLYKSSRVKAEKYYRLSIAEGNAMAARNLGNHHARWEEWDEAIPYYMEAIRLGDVKESLLSLGAVYAGKKEFQNAEKVWTRLGELGDEGGYGAIGSMYKNNKDYKKAEEKFRFCIKKGNLNCYGYLGGLYKVVYEDYDKAIEIYKEGYKAGSMYAANGLGVLYDVKFKDYEKAKLWYKRAADGGYHGGAFNMAYLYQHQFGDIKNATIWYKKAYELGEPRAGEILRKWGEIK